MWCGIVTLFPEMFQALTAYGITGRAIEGGLIDLGFWNPRDFAKDKHRTVDDKPYGGGPGMVMQVEPLRKAIHAAKQAAGGTAKVIYLSPQGVPVTQAKLREHAKQERLIFVAGRYEGIDERLVTLEVDEEWSIGDYVVSGGELPAMVVIDAIIRWLPGALGHEDSVVSDSFSENRLLDCPHYTRPECVAGLEVPSVLLQGNHELIARWRLKQRLGRTWLKRRELLSELTSEQQQLLDEFIEDYEGSEV